MIIASVLFSTHLFTAVLSSVLLLGEKAVKSGNNAMKTKHVTAVLNSPMIYGEVGLGQCGLSVSKICFFKRTDRDFTRKLWCKRYFMDSDKVFALRD